jgi:hypothetical protein
MPEQKTIEKAVLQQITWNEHGDVISEGAEFEVQFNPETLTIALSNQVAGGDQAGGSAIQFNSKGTSKLSFDLIFDVTDPKIDQRFNGDNKPEKRNDVRRITKLVSDFMQTEPVGSGKNQRFVPPGIRFNWGTFRFDGVVNSLNEKIDFFSEDGVPLRSTVSVSITKQDVDINFNGSAPDASGVPNAGTAETATPTEGKGIGDVVGSDQNKPWQGDAKANGIENPRDLAVGMPLLLGTEAAVSLNASLQGKAGLGIGGGISGGFALEGSIGGSFGVGISGGIGLDAGLDASLGLGGGLGADLTGGLGVDMDGSLGFEMDASTDLALNGGASVGVGAGFDAGVSVDGSFNSDFKF